MNLVAVMGSYRKGQTIDRLMDCAIEGVCAVNPSTHVDTIRLMDQEMAYCRNCGLCRRDDPAKPIAHCAINDDMREILPILQEADALILGSPIFEGTVNALTKTFLERICWTLAKPGRWPIRGCPHPRSDVRRRAAAIFSAGIIPPWLRRFCDDATPLVRSTLRDSLNARMIGTLYAGAVETRGMDRYLSSAYALGQKLARTSFQ